MTAVNDMPVIRPGSTIGILGGGQLGRMIALEGRKMGYRFVTLDPAPDCPCGQVADRQIIAPYNDLKRALELAKASDVVTYEFENVDARVTGLLERETYVPQGSALLRITQHRLREKGTLREIGVPVAPYVPVASEAELQAAVDELGLPCVLKTATGGYDGKGQFVIRRRDEVAAAFQRLARPGGELVAERFVPFAKELSVIVARNGRGEMRTFPVAENVHVENILHLSIVPARIDRTTAAKAGEIGARIAEKLNVIGLIAVEMFLTAEGEILVNELAPRPHNSGHYTYDACATSQFEQHVRAICNLPLGSTKLYTPVVMVNILGEHLDAVLAHSDRLPENVKLHLYGKKESRPKRKMGHVNVLASSTEEALATVERLGIWPRLGR
ncbi:5-(carboxyamino)imidazole ribonucleotide synthase [Bacillaceae bacterium]